MRSGDAAAFFGAIAELPRKNDWPGIFHGCGALLWSKAMFSGGDNLFSRPLNSRRQLFSY